MQEHGEVLAHRLVPKPGHVFGCSADHDVVAIFHREPEKFIADRAADRVNLHRQPETVLAVC
jgi:hypothetical protein